MHATQSIMLSIEFDPAEFFYRLDENATDALEGVLQCMADHNVPVEAEWPRSTLTVFTLAVALGYDVTIPRIAKLIEDGSIDPPPIFNGGLAWKAANVAQLLKLLHDRRQWLVGRFWDLKTDAERRRDENKAQQAGRMVRYLKTLPVAEIDRLATEDGEMGELARLTKRLTADGVEL
jgi:hypothetical protein